MSGGAGAAGTSRSRTRKILLGLVPTIALALGAELLVRVTSLAEPSLKTVPLPGERSGLFRSDDELFWSLAPNVTADYNGMPITTNAEGLRAAALSPKAAGEYRILSLGESSTFGVGVPDLDTYTSLLKTYLEIDLPSREITVINGGVPAYSSFQSLKYLELRGLALEPDLVLFYHEINDYLPSSLRDSSNNELGVLMTDEELYESRFQRVRRGLLQYSALLRFLTLRFASFRMNRFDVEGFVNPVLDIGLPDIAFSPRLEGAEDPGQPRFEFNELVLGRRVSDAERMENLKRLQGLSREHGFDLVVIHPAYADTDAHECMLTRFCRDHDVAMFEAFDVLHPDGKPGGRFFLDSFHPNREGHARLARALARFVAEQVLAPAPPGGS